MWMGCKKDLEKELGSVETEQMEFKSFNHSGKKKCLGWRAAQSRLFLKIPGIKANGAKYFYF